MVDIQLLIGQIGGLEGKLKDLRVKKDLFIKAQGFEEQGLKMRAKVNQYESEYQKIREELSKLRVEKADALRITCEALASKMSEALPEGQAAFEIEDKNVFIGWINKDGKCISYNGLSGGQKVSFDASLCYALLGKGEKIIIVEGAELDKEHMDISLKHLTQTAQDTQILFMTCHRPDNIPSEWNIIEV
ncbi:MAG: hypothetical protein HQK79_20635 [Desulfobacterales bacterium]|nr:hypothetical protein [Desulfobacterales bacterium]